MRVKICGIYWDVHNKVWIIGNSLHLLLIAILVCWFSVTFCIYLPILIQRGPHHFWNAFDSNNTPRYLHTSCMGLLSGEIFPGSAKWRHCTSPQTTMDSRRACGLLQRIDYSFPRNFINMSVWGHERVVSMVYLRIRRYWIPNHSSFIFGPFSKTVGGESPPAWQVNNLPQSPKNAQKAPTTDLLYLLCLKLWKMLHSTYMWNSAQVCSPWWNISCPKAIAT